jgi:tRNA threonylcarbamoyladenosine biosynthesis protein TsaE
VREPRRLIAKDPSGTRAIGAALAEALLATDPAAALLVTLTGELGAGKTTLVAGLLERLGHPGPVRSPTYALVESYALAGWRLHHCDLYRLRDPDELDDLGLRDLLGPGAVVLIEWPERAGDRLPPPDLALQLSYADAGRELTLRAATATGAGLLDRLRLEAA